MRIGLEAGPLSQWLFEGLSNAGLPVVCIETRHTKAFLKATVNKTDCNDACGIAQMMRVNLFRPVHVKTISSQQRRALLTRKLINRRWKEVPHGTMDEVSPLCNLYRSGLRPGRVLDCSTSTDPIMGGAMPDPGEKQGSVNDVQMPVKVEGSKALDLNTPRRSIMHIMRYVIT